MKTIKYTKRNKEEEISQEDSTKEITFYKHFYENNVLYKSEYHYKNNITKVEIFIYEDDNEIEDERVLFKQISIQNVEIIRVKKYGSYSLFHTKSFSNLLLKSEVFDVFDINKNIIATYNYRNEHYEIHNYKYLYTENEKPLRFSYFDTGKLVEKELQNIATNTSNLPVDYYVSFFPFLPNQEEIQPEVVKYFSSDDNEINLQQAFFGRHFYKKTYKNGILQKIDSFGNNEIFRKTLFLYDQNTNLKKYLSNKKIETIIYLFEGHKSGFKKWRVSYFINNLLTKTQIKVWDYLEKEIYNQEIDLDGNIVSTTKKSFFYENEYSYLDKFYYNKTGKLITKEIFEDDGWHGIEHKISDLRKQGFFKTEYGKYFLNAAPEIPEIKNPITSYKKIYKNHLGQIVEKHEAESLYEYKEEIFVNNNLIEKTTRKALSKERLKEKSFYSFKEVFVDDFVDISATESNAALSNVDILYHNRRIENNYNVYDFVVTKFGYSIGKNKGIAVYDNYFREISKLFFEGFSDEIMSAEKTYYSSSPPIIGDEIISVLYNKNGEIEQYKENSLTDLMVHSPKQFESEYFFSVSPVNENYYKQILPLVPENKAFPYIDFEKSHYKYYEESREHKINIFLEKGKLKIASVKPYQHFYFLNDEKSVEEYYKMFSAHNFICFIYNIHIKRNEVIFDFSYAIEVTARLKINLLTKNISSIIFKNEENKICFKKYHETNYSEMYAFFYNDERIWATEFDLNTMIELLLMT